MRKTRGKYGDNDGCNMNQEVDIMERGKREARSK